MTEYTVLKGDRGRFVVPSVTQDHKVYEHEGSIEANSLNEAYFMINEHYSKEDLEPPTLENVTNPDIKGLVGKEIKDIKGTTEGDYFITFTDGTQTFCSLHKVVSA